MSAHAAIAGRRDPRPTRVRYPNDRDRRLLPGDPHCRSDLSAGVTASRSLAAVGVSGTIADFVVWTLWLAVLLGTYARQPDGRLWKLIFLMMVTGRVAAVTFVPNSVVWSVAGWQSKSRWASLSSSW